MSKFTASILTILAMAGSLTGLWWLFTGKPPALEVDLLNKTELVMGLATLFAAPAIGLVVFVLITRLVENPLIRFLNGLWLPSDKPIENLTEEDTGKSWYITQPGERHEMTIVSNWWATTFLKLVKPGIAMMGIGAIIGAAQYFLLDLSLSTRALISVGINTFCLIILEPFYIYTEWFRRNTLVLVFTYTLIYLKAYDGGVFGLLTGLVDDVRRRETPIVLIREPEIATDPRRIMFRDKEFRDLRNTFFDILGSQKPRGALGRLLWRLFKPLATGVRTLFLPSFFEKASDTFISISHGEMFLSILKKLQGQARSSQQDMELVSREAASIRLRLGKNVELDEDEAQVESDIFMAERMGTMTPRTTINLWACRTDPSLWNLRTGTLATFVISARPSARYHRLEITSSPEFGNPDTLETHPGTEENHSDWVPPLN